MTVRARAELPGWLLVMAEVLLASVSFAVVLGFGRVFQGGDFGGSLIVVALYTHLAVAALRRWDRGVAVSFLLSSLGLVLVLTWLHFADTTTALVPTGRTLDAARAATSEAVDLFQNVLAPAPAVTGFLLAASIAIFLAAFLADWAAFRLWSGVEALVPPFTLFVFCSLLGSEQLRLPATAAFAATTLAFFVTHRTARRSLSARWVADDIDTGAWSIVRTGLVITLAVTVAGVALVGQRLPGAGSGAIVSWRDDGDGPGDRFTISPLVEINARLVDQSDLELFTVRAEEAAYWRLTSLETFDGSAWRSKGRFTDAGEDLGRAPEASNPVELVQQYDIERLGGLWLPTAMTPERLTGDVRASYHDDSSTLIVDGEVDDADGFSYTITSGVGTYTPEELRGADALVPPGIVQRYLDLPDDFSPMAAALAEEQTVGQETAYDKARALQDWFQSDRFTYDLDVPAGHSEDAIETFLTSGRGYCEQFAGTFAAMARHVGVPARVAVGFTPGERDATDPNVFHVRGLHAHAWPEVWLGEFGWVPFEPTKSRGAPGAEAWTGLQPAQADEPATSTSSTVTEGSSVPTTTAAGPTTTVAPGAGATDLDTGPGSTTDSAAGGPPSIVLALLGALVVGVVALGAWVLGLRLASGRLEHRAERADAAGTPGHQPDERVRRAWSDALDHLELVGRFPTPSDTHTEFAAREATGLDSSGPALMTLARTTDLATFAPAQVDDAQASDAAEALQQIIHEVTEQMSTGQRVRAAVDPRPFWRRWRRR